MINEKEANKLLQAGKVNSLTAEAVLKRALNLRESIYRLFKSVIEGWQPELKDLETLNRELSVTRRHQKLPLAKTGFIFQWINHSETLDRMLWQISESTANLLINGDLTKIHRW